MLLFVLPLLQLLLYAAQSQHRPISNLFAKLCPVLGGIYFKTSQSKKRRVFRPGLGALFHHSTYPLVTNAQCDAGAALRASCSTRLH